MAWPPITHTCECFQELFYFQIYLSTSYRGKNGGAVRPSVHPEPETNWPTGRRCPYSQQILLRFSIRNACNLKQKLNLMIRLLKHSSLFERAIKNVCWLPLINIIIVIKIIFITTRDCFGTQHLALGFLCSLSALLLEDPLITQGCQLIFASPL